MAHQGLSAIFAHVQIIKCEYARFYPCIFAFFHLCLSVLFCFVLLCSSLRLCSPHLCVRFLFLVLYPVRLLSSSFRPCFVTPTFTQLFHTHAHIFVTHTTLSHTHLCHTQLCHTPSFTQLCHTHLCHTQLCHTPSFTQLCHTHFCHTQLGHTHLCHTQLSHTQLCHTHTHHLSHSTLSYASLSHTTLSHTIFHTQLCHTRFCHTHSFATHTQLCHTQLYHTHTPSFTHNFVTHIFVTHTTWSHTSLSHATLSHTIFAWLAWWPLATSTLHLRGRRSTWRHPPTPMLCVAGLALGGTSTALCVARVCHLWHGGALSRGCVAGVALGDIDVAFAWEACRLAGSTYVCVAGMGLWHWAASGGALQVARAPRHLAWQASHLATSTCTFRGRPGAWRHPPMFCVAGVALMALGWVWWCPWGPSVVGALRHFAWQASRLATSTCTLRGRSGTWRHSPTFCVAGVAHCGAALAGVAHMALGAALCAAGVALGDIDLGLAWQAWHLATSTCTLRGKRGTWRHPPMFCVAGVTLMVIKAG